MRKKIGNFGEDIAADYLIEKGYVVLERNYQNRYGEIDIIAEEDGYLCFVEVKTRQWGDDYSAFESVTQAKQKTLGNMALGYLQERELIDPLLRFDVIAVIFNEENSPQIHLIKDAFVFDN